MARANRASYKTCFVFRLYDHSTKEMTFLNHYGEWVVRNNNTDLLVKCFDQESAVAIAKYIREHMKEPELSVETEETECDIVQELQLYSFVNEIVQDLQKVKL